MNRDYEILRELKETETRLKELYLASWRVGCRWQAVAAVCGLAGSVVAATFGTLLSAGAWVLGDKTNGISLHGVGSILLLSTIPLLLLGAHCLDLLEKRMEKSQRIEGDGSMKAAELADHTRSHVAVTIALFLLLCAMPLKTQAQQTVFNVPTTDILAPGKVYFELDISAKPNNSKTLPRFSSLLPRFVVGVGERIEVGLNVTGNIQPGPDATTLVPTVKWKVYEGGHRGWAIALGNNLFIPIRNKAYDVGTFSYVMVSKSFKTNTRIGFGGSFFSENVVAPDANRAGGQFTFEQSITKRLNLNADWYTGRHANGYLTTGAVYKFTNKLTCVTAYSIGNIDASKGNHFFYFDAGYNLN